MLVRVTVPFLAGLVLAAYLPFLPVTIFATLVCVAIALTYGETRRWCATWAGVTMFASALAGLVYGAVTPQVTGDSLPSVGVGQERAATVIGTVAAPVRRTHGRVVMLVDISRLGEEAVPKPAAGRLRLVWRTTEGSPRQGDLVKVTARLRAPAGTRNPGGFDYGLYLRRHGVDAVASVSGPGQVTVLASPVGLSVGRVRWMIDDARDRIRLAAERSLTGTALGLYLGMIIGEAGYVEAEARDAFMNAGVVHILSISGSHLGLIAFLTFWVVRWSSVRLPASWLNALSRRVTPTRLAALLTTIPVTFYTLLAGAEVATVRSLVMILVCLLAVWMGRTQRLLVALAGAAALIVLHDPRAVFDISFQLSYLSVLAIALVVTPGPEGTAEAGPWPASWRDRVRRWSLDCLMVGGAVTLATLPLVAYYFNHIPWLGLFTNLVVVPLAGVVVVPVGLASAIWLLVTGGDTLPAAALNQVLLEALEGVVGVAARVPGSRWSVASPAISVILAYLVGLWVILRTGSGARARVLCAVLLLGMIGWWAWSPRWWLDGRTARVTFLDVGQGDAAVIELPGGETVLIDGGATYETLDMGRSVVGPFLWDRGIRRLDYVIATHPQLDHVGGLTWVLQQYEVGEYWSNGVQRDERFFQRLAAVIRERKVAERVVRRGLETTLSGRCRLRVLSPEPVEEGAVGGSPRESGTALNNLSVVVRLTCGPHAFLFGADVEREGLRRLANSPTSPPVRVLKVPHHGARSSLETAWIAQVRPDVAVISSGRHNPYGHPAAEVLDAYQSVGARVFRTDRLGAVWVVTHLDSDDWKAESCGSEALEAVRLGDWSKAREEANLWRVMGAICWTT